VWYNKYIKGKENPPNQKGIDTMTNSKKMTKRDYFTILRASYPETASNYDEVIAFIDHELELLAKKNSAEKKPTAVQVANEGIKSAIVEGMEPNRLYTITELIKEIPECADMTNQRVSALVRQLKDELKVERVEEKRKAYFRLAQ
jgi:hypothetical protein